MIDPFERATDQIYAKLGKPAEYDGEEGMVPDVLVIVSHDLTQWGDTIQVQNGMAVVAVRRNQVQARPRRGDTFTLETGRVYQVERIMQSDDLEHRCLTVEEDDD